MESCSADREETGNTLAAELPPEDQSAVSAASAAAAETAVSVSVADREEYSAPSWRLNDEYSSQVLIQIVSAQSALTGPDKDGQRSGAPPTHISHHHRAREV